MEEEEALPDHLRCKRTDGRQWRCSRRVMEDKKLCEVHHLQGRHRQYKQKVPESLKLQRKNKKVINRDSVLENFQIRARKVDKLVKPVKRKRLIGESEALDEAVRKMKLKRGDLRLELIRMVLKREVEKRKRKKSNSDDNDSDSDSDSDGELMRDLPNGLMAISSAPESGNAGSSCDVKIGTDPVTVTMRRFRSKNIEPVPIGTLQVVPYKQNVVSLKRRRRRKCHWCRRSFPSLINCLSCQQRFFCMDCIKERFACTQEEVKMACPVCRGTCGCKACSASQFRDIECKDLLRDKNKVDKVLHFHYLICMLLPVLKQINQEQSIELEIVAKIKGQRPSEIQINQAECNKQHCCNCCKAYIVEMFRSCSNCSYSLCLSCCRDVFQGSLSGSVKALICKCPNRRKACMSGMQFSDKNSVSTCKQIYSGTYLDSSASLPSPEAPDGSVGISCPPTEFGGCGDSLLDLRCLFPLSWTKELEINAEEIVGSYDCPETLDIFSHCSLCFGMNHEANGIKQLQEAARREDSYDNFLYYPTVMDIHGDNLEHFQKHWGKGHPVIVQNVLQSKSDLSWDPVVMYCTHLKNTGAKSENNEEALKATDCLDWFEVEIGIQQLFLGSLRGRSHANVCNEKLRLKGWLSSHLFQEQFPAHYAEIIHALPLPEYMDPKSGLLNVAAKLPQEMPKPDLGPSVYMSYCSGEEIVQADSVMQLCCDLCDVVNILAYSTDVPVSTEQLSNLRTLMKKHEAQDQMESTNITLDHKMANKVKGISLLHGENMKLKRVSRVSRLAAAVHKAHFLGLRDREMFPEGQHESDSNSEESIHRCRNIQSSKISENQKLPREHTESFDYFINGKSAKSCGAQWDVFRRQDVPKLIEYLRKHSDEFTHPCSFRRHVVHPIFDQNFFLDTTHKKRLKEEFKIEPWTFEQHDGEAVIIPAGCPYQIRNLKSCVNVVLDFVSPEHVTKCIQLIDELRLLPEDHIARADKLEVKKMALHGISAAVKEIRDLTCAGNSATTK